MKSHFSGFFLNFDFSFQITFWCCASGTPGRTWMNFCSQSTTNLIFFSITFSCERKGLPLRSEHLSSVGPTAVFKMDQIVENGKKTKLWKCMKSDEISGSVITGSPRMYYVNFKGQRFWHRLRIENNLQNWHGGKKVFWKTPLQFWLKLSPTQNCSEIQKLMFTICLSNHYSVLTISPWEWADIQKAWVSRCHCH